MRMKDKLSDRERPPTTVGAPEREAQERERIEHLFGKDPDHGPCEFLPKQRNRNRSPDPQDPSNPFLHPPGSLLHSNPRPAKATTRTHRNSKAKAQALATARVFIRWQCERTERVRRGMTADLVADAIRRWALANGECAFVTTAITRAALQIEDVREYNDGYRSAWFALRLPEGTR
jgi:hypothetical protein